MPLSYYRSCGHGASGGCYLPSEPFFLRFRWNDADALQRELAEAQAAYQQARKAADAAHEIESACRLGIALTVSDREHEACAILEDALAKARTLGEATPIAWSLLYLATARQYLDEREIAQSMFSEALDITQRHHLRDIEHYVLHHQGRCCVEQRRYEEARRSFKHALELRLALGELRAERTREALAALDALEAPS